MTCYKLIAFTRVGRLLNIKRYASGKMALICKPSFWLKSGKDYLFSNEMLLQYIENILWDIKLRNYCVSLNIIFIEEYL